MAKIFTGGCSCGAVRYEIQDEPFEMADCQCRQCQRRSGTGHGSYMSFPSRTAVKLTGTAREWEVTGDGGTVKRHAFCGVCGSPVYLTIPAAPDLFIVHAASLDDPGSYRPQHVLYRSSAQPWDPVDPKVPAHDRMPPRTAAG